MHYCVIDIGSNTVKLAVYDSNNENRFQPIYFKSYQLKLIEKRHQGCLSEEGCILLENALCEFYSRIKYNKFEPNVRVFGTEALRRIKNHRRVSQMVENAVHGPLEVLSPMQEARFSYLGICATEKIKDGMMIDLGGGSTEFLSFRDHIPEDMHSFKFGAISLNEKLFLSGISNLQRYANMKLRQHNFIKNNDLPLYLVGGSAKAVLTAKKLLFDDSNYITHEQLYQMNSRLQNADDALQEKLYVTIRDRQEQLPGVIFFLYCALCVSNQPQALVVSSGVREGYVWDWMRKNKEFKI